MNTETFEDELNSVLNMLRTVLLQKNKAYGDAALNPVRIFSKLDSVEQILIRIDDKISRLSRGESAGEDVYLDLMGYLILLKIAKNRIETKNRTVLL